MQLKTIVISKSNQLFLRHAKTTVLSQTFYDYNASDWPECLNDDSAKKNEKSWEDQG